jgi:caa(3)-type oxidase subunit IV
VSTQSADKHGGIGIYVAIWVALVLLLTASVGFRLPSPAAAAMLVYLIASVKAYLVLSYFMHLKLEPRFVGIIMLSGLAAGVILFVGLYSDIVEPFGGMP